MAIQSIESTQKADLATRPELRGALREPQIADIRVKGAEARAEKPQIVEELMIEEVSIDGMCGVY